MDRRDASQGVLFSCLVHFSLGPLFAGFALSRCIVAQYLSNILLMSVLFSFLIIHCSHRAGPGWGVWWRSVCFRMRGFLLK